MNKKIDGLLRLAFYLGTFLLLIWPVPEAGAQTRRDRRQTPPPASPRANEAADISITATVTARELKFEVVPNVTVTFPGTFARDTVWDAEREGLPRPVEPGVIYQNIGVRLVITSIFPEFEKIVSETEGQSTKPTVSPPKRPEPPAPPLPIAPRRPVNRPPGRAQQ